jgi:predicted NAD/FAD-binding protein
VFTLAGMRAQERWAEINGDSTWYCGAYWRNGFHEDGVYSAKRVADAIGTQSQVSVAQGVRAVGSAA